MQFRGICLPEVLLPLYVAVSSAVFLEGCPNHLVFKSQPLSVPDTCKVSVTKGQPPRGWPEADFECNATYSAASKLLCPSSMAVPKDSTELLCVPSELGVFISPRPHFICV